MRTIIRVCTVALAVSLFTVGDASARGGGRGGGGRGGGGFSRGGGGYGGRGGSRGYGGASRSVSRSPSISRSVPSYSRPSTGMYNRPGTGARPSRGDLQNFMDLPRPSTGATARPAAGARPGGANLAAAAGAGFAGGAAADFLRNQGARPGTLPASGQRPVAGTGTRPGIENRPGSGERPGVGERPGIGNRPGVGDRPGVGNRPGAGNRPGVGERPGVGDRPGIGNRPAIGDRPGVGNRPGAANRPLAGSRPVHIEDRQQLHNNRVARCDEIRHDVRHNYPRLDFWSNYPNWAAWRIRRPYRWATWGGLTGWVDYGWSQPVYYAYGENIYYEDDSVYYDDQVIASAEEYAQQAEQIATTVLEVDPGSVEWMPLGVFALTPDDQASGPDPTLFLQLAISRDGIISGTLHNSATDTTQTVEGMADKDSQRAAWTVAGKSWPVMECGVGNLTEETLPALVHFEDGQTQQWLMVRLEDPTTQQQ